MSGITLHALDQRKNELYKHSNIIEACKNEEIQRKYDKSRSDYISLVEANPSITDDQQQQVLEQLSNILEGKSNRREFKVFLKKICVENELNIPSTKFRFSGGSAVLECLIQSPLLLCFVITG